MGGNLALWKLLAIRSNAIQEKAEARTVLSPMGPTTDLPEMALPRDGTEGCLMVLSQAGIPLLYRSH